MASISSPKEIDNESRADCLRVADVLELRGIAQPAPGDGEVLIRVRAAGVDQGVWHLMTGLPYLGPALWVRAEKAEGTCPRPGSVRRCGSGGTWRGPLCGW
jgi:hypothetical protein